MGLNEQWTKLCEQERTPKDNDIFWGAYFETEKGAYRDILLSQNNVVSGTAAELADRFEMTKAQIAGFVDGINTSLETEIDLETLEADTHLELVIIWEKLYENMLNAKADWLYNLDEWEPILSVERRQEIKRSFNQSRMAVSTKVGRNEPCPCGSGLKYKKCCMDKAV